MLLDILGLPGVGDETLTPVVPEEIEQLVQLYWMNRDLCMEIPSRIHVMFIPPFLVPSQHLQFSVQRVQHKPIVIAHRNSISIKSLILFGQYRPTIPNLCANGMSSTSAAVSFERLVLGLFTVVLSESVGSDGIDKMNKIRNWVSSQTFNKSCDESLEKVDLLSGDRSLQRRHTHYTGALTQCRLKADMCWLSSILKEPWITRKTGFQYLEIKCGASAEAHSLSDTDCASSLECRSRCIPSSSPTLHDRFIPTGYPFGIL
ncbi:hypothetical protein C0J52_18550 [Blattella germanica]|nr:hypothetical protein C0J52_18550 [Blattella germanica]